MAIEITEELDEFGSPIVFIRDPEKVKTTYSVYKGHNGFSFFEIRLSEGRAPKELQGQYTNQKDAEKAVCRYLEKRPKSAIVRRDENAEERRKKKQKKIEEAS